MSYKSIKCPNCGATIQLDSNHKTLFCEFCGTSLVKTADTSVATTIIKPGAKKIATQIIGDIDDDLDINISTSRSKKRKSASKSNQVSMETLADGITATPQKNRKDKILIFSLLSLYFAFLSCLFIYSLIVFSSSLSALDIFKYLCLIIALCILPTILFILLTIFFIREKIVVEVINGYQIITTIFLSKKEIFVDGILCYSGHGESANFKLSDGTVINTVFSNKR